MAKKEYAKKEEKKEYAKDSKYAEKKDTPKEGELPAPTPLDNLPPEVKKQMEELKGKLDQFKDEVLKKFDKYIQGLALLPPPLGQDGKPVKEDKVNLLVMVDDSDSKKMSKQELKDKLGAIVIEIGKKIDPKFTPEVVIVSEFWQNCFDAKYELNQLIALSVPFYDTGILSAIKLGEIHKSMVLKKFEKYIVSYVLFGSITRGEATPESDIDVSIIIDDTDVKKMTRVELKDKLRAIIIGMGFDASQMTGIKKSFNIQVYILTEFWESVKEAHPVIFTVLRDGVPFYDRGMFTPWKQLLKMGRIKPSREAIDMFMSSGEQMVSRVRRKMLDVVEADIYWSTLTPTQAAIMLYGIAPPTPRETLELVEEVFVKKEKLLEPKYLETLKLIRQYYKKLEHGELKSITGKEVDDLITKAEDYLKRIKKLFGEIEVLKEKESVQELYDHTATVVRDLLKGEGVEKVKEEDLVDQFDECLVSTGKLGAKNLTLLKGIVKAYKEFAAGKLTKTSVEKVKKEYRELINALVEYVQRSRARDLDRAKVRVKYGGKYGEVLIFEKFAFITHDIDATEKEVHKASVNADGSLGVHEKSTLEALEQAIIAAPMPPSVTLKTPLFESIKKIFGKDAEVIVHR